MYGLQFSNPVETRAAYRGSESQFGSKQHPIVGERIGGINVFGGGLGLYDAQGSRVGVIGVSGDTSCRDHMVAWETGHNLSLDYVSGGVSGDPERPDYIIFDVDAAFGYPNCLYPASEVVAAETLTPVQQ